MRTLSTTNKDGLLMIDKIPADEDTILTTLLKRAFQYHSCNPACHCCGNDINVGEIFKLASIEAEEPWNKGNFYDHMLCRNCTAQDYIDKQALRRTERERRAGMGFSRPHLVKL